MQLLKNCTVRWILIHTQGEPKIKRALWTKAVLMQPCTDFPVRFKPSWRLENHLTILGSHAKLAYFCLASISTAHAQLYTAACFGSVIKTENRPFSHCFYVKVRIDLWAISFVPRGLTIRTSFSYYLSETGLLYLTCYNVPEDGVFITLPSI